MSKGSWINTALSWIAKKRGFSLKPLAKSVSPKTSPPTNSTRNISGEGYTYNLWLSNAEKGEMPWGFCSSDTVSARTNELTRIAGYIAGITNTPVTLHRQCISGTKTEYQIGVKPCTFRFDVSYTTYVDGKPRTRLRPFKSWIDTLSYLVSNYGNTTVKIAYRTTSNSSERPFYFQTYTNGVIS